MHKITRVLYVLGLLVFGLQTQTTNSQNPNWSVNSSSFALDMQIVGAVKIDGKPSTQTTTRIAAFDEDNNIRGVANLSFFAALNKYVFFLTVYGNKGGEQLSFRIYDATLDIVILVPRTKLEFIPNNIVGDIVNPFNLDAQSNVLPSVKTFNANNTSISTATLKGAIIAAGASTITEKGFIYSTEDSYPKLDEANITKVTNSSNSREFTNTIANLNTGQNIYFFRAYATNSFGTSYGDVKRFSLNNGLNFDKIDDVVSIPDNSAFDFSEGFSTDIMLYPTSFDGESTIISQTAAFSLSIKSGGIIEAKISTDGTNFMTFTTNLRVELNKWQHLAFTYQNTGNIKIYIKGVDDVTGRTTNAQTGTIFNTTNNIQIGANNNTNYFQGTLDELRIWNTTLPETKIKAIQRKVIPTQIRGLVAYYNCNQGITEGNNSNIAQLLDKTQNNIHGTLVGFAKNGNTSNFINGVSGDFQKDKIAQNTFMNSGNWSNPNNWSFGVIPSKIDRVIINENQTITIDTNNLEVDDLVLGNNATIKIPKDKAIIINNEFESNGNLELDSDSSDSGVLLVNGTTNGTVTYKRGGLLANKWSIVTPPVSGQKIKVFAQNLDNDIRVNTEVNPNRYAIAYYDDSNIVGKKWVYYTQNTSENDEFIAGDSYSMSRATDGAVTFVGTLNVDNLKRSLVAGKWNAIGNPFTTYYPANKNNNNSFLTDNFDILDDTFKSLYIWDNTQNKYVAVSNVSETAKSLPPGQGFFIKLKNEDASINFQKDKRTFKPSSGNSDFEKNTQEPSLKIIAKKGKTTVATHIKFFDNASSGFDTGFDIGNFEAANFDIYTQLPSNTSTQNFTIQSLSSSAITDAKIQLGIKGKKGDEIEISALTTNLPTQVHLYLEDKQTNSLISLNDKNANYSFTLQSDTNGVGRFLIHLTTSVLNTENFTINDLDFYTNNKTIVFKEFLNPNTTIILYSLLGTKVWEKEVNNHNKKIFSLNSLNNGIYLVKVKLRDREYSKKIILK